MSTTYTENYNLGMQKDHSDKFDMGVITDNMEKIDEALAGKQDTLTPTQLAAINSGITTEKVSQIDDNAAAISEIDSEEDKDRAALVELVDSGAKNIAVPITFPVNPSGHPNVVITQDGKGHYEISGTTSNSQLTLYLYNSSETYNCKNDMFIMGANSIVAPTGINIYKTQVIDENEVSRYPSMGTTGYNVPATWKIRSIYIQIPANTTFSINVDFMVCPKSLYDISPTYQPYRPSYEELYERVVALENQS